MLAKWGVGLRAALGDAAVRIDHIGSTSVPGPAAKPVIDIQISVTSLEPSDEFMVPLTGMGFVYRADNPERTKRYFREPPGQQRTHVHVRQLGTFSQQIPLLFRGYLRCHTSCWCAARYSLGVIPTASRNARVKSEARGKPQRAAIAPMGTDRAVGSASFRRQRARR